ncbi:hypothetical protein D1641_01110 [Colidextribacter sp. OB.20]|uniref:hypothetical protein n=1 Tax=Colidextribacter sp. OB.20 TaxID=2304568 RepID=UPI00136FB792|nr:hypothetical protein [Colidextribacter sp. OB.20]NBI08620.1 hypothetical protein [Colidextribacter sp. OB.20]
MNIMPHATRTSLRRLLLSKGVEVPPVQDLVMGYRCRLRAYAPTFVLRWRDSRGKHHMVIYYFCDGQPYLDVDSKTVPITTEEVQLHGLYKEKE